MHAHRLNLDVLFARGKSINVLPIFLNYFPVCRNGSSFYIHVSFFIIYYHSKENLSTAYIFLLARRDVMHESMIKFKNYGETITFIHIQAVLKFI